MTDLNEYEMIRQRWDTVNRPKYTGKKWSSDQEKALRLIREGIAHEDEESKNNSYRWLYINGAPGSGKTAVLLEAAIEASQFVEVMIVCPTGNLVYLMKSKLPDREGVERIRIDTIQGVLNYKRPGPDGKIKWTPPSALRRIDLILMDEASQYEDQEWKNMFGCIMEQPHKPYVVVVADFQQLQPVVSKRESGSMCQQFCAKMQTVELKTVYRTADEDHLLFQNRIRKEQPTRATLEGYWSADRHWKKGTLAESVARGESMAKQGTPFTWLTTTNRGAAEVCEAAIRNNGVWERISEGYASDPTSKSDMRIVAEPGVLLRLTRNFDKVRGFVNGALVRVCKKLKGNEVFTAEIVGSGNMVLVHPMEEDGCTFLPCCYGYATTIRRAQGADLEQGCIYFDQRRPAERGYGYVAVSRFKQKARCYLYGKIRRTDFLPVNPREGAKEVCERGALSESSSEDESGIELAGDHDSDVSIGGFIDTDDFP